MSDSLVEHARRELTLIGQFESDPAYSQSIVAAVSAFASFAGHSGGSAAVAIGMLHALLQRHALAPLTTNPAEWMDRSKESGGPWWQNIRDSRAMSHDHGATYWLVDDGPGVVYTSDVHSPKGE